MMVKYLIDSEIDFYEDTSTIKFPRAQKYFVTM